MKIKSTLLAAVISVFAGAGSQSYAAILLQDDFNDIPDGPLVNDSVWSAFSGADNSVTVAGGVVSLGSGAEDVSTSIGTDVVNVYFGVTITVSTAASSDYVIAFRDGNSLAARFFLDDTGSGIRLGVNSGGTGGGSAGNFSTKTFNLNEDVRLVGFADGAGVVSAWINPTEGDLATPDATFSNADAGGFEEFAFRQGGNWDNGGAAWTADDLTVSTTFAEAIPEPSAALLGGLGLLALLRRRR